MDSVSVTDREVNWEGHRLEPFYSTEGAFCAMTFGEATILGTQMQRHSRELSHAKRSDHGRSCIPICGTYDVPNDRRSRKGVLHAE